MANSDLGHKLTDKELAKLEHRIAKLYSEAGKELQATIDAYFEQFKKRDEEMKALIGTVQNGKEWTEADYKQWRLNQIGRGERYQAMRDKVAQRATDANAVAVSYTNDATPGIYSLNRNYAAYTIERVTGNIGFDLWDEQTVKRLMVEQPDLMPYYPKDRALKRGIDLAYGKKQITASVTSSILQGKSIKHMADDLQKRITTMSRDSAIRTARTAVTGAQNAGRMDSYAAAEKMGIKLKKEWLATLDARTRHSHAMLDGEQVAQDKKFSNGCRFPGDPQGPPWEIYNCFVGETQIASDGEIVRSYKHEYDGELFEVETAGGVNFACTPNHPVLTSRGWVAAALLNEGDNLLIANIGNSMLPGGNPDINHVFPRMDAFHEFFDVTFGQRISTLRVNFHGDIPASDVEVVTHKRLLRNYRNASGRKCIYKILLKIANESFMGKSAAVKHLWRVCKSTLSVIRGRRKALPFAFRCLGHTGVHGFGAVPNVDTGVIEPTINDLTANPILFREFLDGFPCEVFPDNIIRINRIVAKCHVYNLQTTTGHYFVNTSIPQSKGKCNGNFAIVHNCRCTLIAAVDGVDTSDGLRRTRDGLISDMTYAQWEASKQGYSGKQLSPYHMGIEKSAKDVTKKYIDSAKPRMGKVRYENGYRSKNHKEEINVANQIRELFGGKIVLLKESQTPGMKMPDMLWKGKQWEIKSISTEKAADSALRKAIKQIHGNQGGVIFDVADGIDKQKLIDVLDARATRSKSFNADIIALHNGSVLFVRRYKK
jgi:SPP1 gp7 family putative phage head morphogenesis protein